VKQVHRTESGFTILDQQDKTITECQQVVYATGANLVLDRLIEHPLLEKIPLRPIRGQVILVRPTEESKKVPHCLVDSGYTSPVVREISGSDTHCIGATYQAKTVLEEQERIDTDALLEEGRQRHPAFASLKREDVISSRSAYRLSTPDKLPLIGPLCDPDQLKAAFGVMLRSGFESGSMPLPAESGEWLFTGMGSRGMTFSSYGAEILAAMMTGQTVPIESDLLEHIHPARFIVRNLKKPENSGKKA